MPTLADVNAIHASGLLPPRRYLAAAGLARDEARRQRDDQRPAGRQREEAGKPRHGPA